MIPIEKKSVATGVAIDCIPPVDAVPVPGSMVVPVLLNRNINPTSAVDGILNTLSSKLEPDIAWLMPEFALGFNVWSTAVSLRLTKFCRLEPFTSEIATVPALCRPEVALTTLLAVLYTRYTFTPVGSVPVAPLREVNDLKSKFRKLNPWNLALVVAELLVLWIVWNSDEACELVSTVKPRPFLMPIASFSVPVAFCQVNTGLPLKDSSTATFGSVAFFIPLKLSTFPVPNFGWVEKSAALSGLTPANVNGVPIFIAGILSTFLS